jgi:hypothetical protein
MDQPAEMEAQEEAEEQDSETTKPVERTDTEAAGE